MDGTQTVLQSTRLSQTIRKSQFLDSEIRQIKKIVRMYLLYDLVVSLTLGGTRGVNFIVKR